MTLRPARPRPAASARPVCRGRRTPVPPSPLVLAGDHRCVDASALVFLGTGRTCSGCRRVEAGFSALGLGSPRGVAAGLHQFERSFILRLNDRSRPLPEDEMELLYALAREGEQIKLTVCLVKLTVRGSVRPIGCKIGSFAGL